MCVENITWYNTVFVRFGTEATAPYVESWRDENALPAIITNRVIIEFVIIDDRIVVVVVIILHEGQSTTK